jgi:hypothetical protein
MRLSKAHGCQSTTVPLSQIRVFLIVGTVAAMVFMQPCDKPGCIPGSSWQVLHFAQYQDPVTGVAAVSSVAS